MVVWRPNRAYLIGMALIITIPAIAFGSVSLVMARYRRFGWLPFTIVALLLAVALVYFLVTVRRMRLVLDETGVTVIDAFGKRGSCPAGDLAAIRLVAGSKGSQWWGFIRRDGSVAFQADVGLWPRAAMEEIADKFSAQLQLTHEDQRSRYSCPVCGYARLEEPPQRDGVASHEICPSCGFEFGVTDGIEGKTYASWREQWVQAGMPWWATQAGREPPKGWDPAAQVKSVSSN